MPSISNALGLNGSSTDLIIQEIERKLEYVGIPRSLSEIGVPLECKRRIAEKAMLDSATETNPRATTVEEMEDLTEVAISGAR